MRVCATRWDRRMIDEESLQRIQVHVTAELVGAEVEHCEIIAAGGEK